MPMFLNKSEVPAEAKIASDGLRRTASGSANVGRLALLPSSGGTPVRASAGHLSTGQQAGCRCNNLFGVIQLTAIYDERGHFTDMYDIVAPACFGKSHRNCAPWRRSSQLGMLATP